MRIHVAPGIAIACVIAVAAGCRESNAIDLVCQHDVECPEGLICGPLGLCTEGCHTNDDCPEDQVCSQATGTCSGGGPDSDTDADSDSNADSDTDTDSDTDGDPGCPEPGTTTCDQVGQCAETPIDCTCLDLFDLGGYCYSDCQGCEQPHECIQGGCLYVGQLIWEFDLLIIDPDVGGGQYIELDLVLEELDVTFIYAYAIIDEGYGFAWIVALAPVGNDGGYALQLGIQLSVYGVGDLTPAQMNTSATVNYYESWEDENPHGLAASIWDDTPVLTLTAAGTEVGEHVVGSLDIRMMEYNYDY